MKRVIIFTIFAFALSMNLLAQSDGFFDYYEIDNKRTETIGFDCVPTLPSKHGIEEHVGSNVSLGGGVLLLAAFAVIRHKSRNKRD